jgi:hypothetical protein
MLRMVWMVPCIVIAASHVAYALPSDGPPLPAANQCTLLAFGVHEEGCSSIGIDNAAANSICCIYECTCNGRTARTQYVEPIEDPGICSALRTQSLARGGGVITYSSSSADAITRACAILEAQDD